MEESRRDFLKKTGKAVFTGAAWSAISVLGIGAAGCSNSGYDNGYNNYNCDYCQSCTYSQTYDYNRLDTTATIILSGQVFDSNTVYTVNMNSSLDQLSYNTNEFGAWYGNQFTGRLTIYHDRSEDVTITLTKIIFQDLNFTEKAVRAFNTSSDNIDVIFDSFPVGAYFSVRSNQTSSPIGTVSINIKDQSNNIVSSGVTDTNGAIKFSAADQTHPDYPLKANIPYTADFIKAGFKDTTQTFTLQTNGGITKSSAFVVYMIPG